MSPNSGSSSDASGDYRAIGRVRTQIPIGYNDAFAHFHFQCVPFARRAVRVTGFRTSTFSESAHELQQRTPGQGPSARFQRHHRNPCAKRSGQIRSRQGHGPARRRPFHRHRHALSRQLRLHSADALRRRRSGRRACHHAVPAPGRLGRALARARHAADDGRIRRRRETDRRAARQDLPDDGAHEVHRRRARVPERPDQALLRTLQGARKRQVGEGRRLGRRRRRTEGNHRRRRELQEVSGSSSGSKSRACSGQSGHARLFCV